MDKTPTKKLSANTKRVIMPVMYLFLLAVISLFVFRAGWDKISTLNKNLKKAKKEESILSEKLQILEEAQIFLNQYAQDSVEAIPAGNSSLVILSQLKTLGVDSEVELSQFDFGSLGAGGGGLSKIELSLNVDGENQKVLDYLRKTREMAPIIAVNKMTYNRSGDNMTTGLDLSSFWAPLPTDLPPIDSPLVKLSQNEIQLLQELRNLNPPIYSSLDPEGINAERTNPFTL